ncbi:hypothetical protein [Aliagarivorans taiwanensis]|uniref:hypothetical protein n=1 Tax=Aliagarivorans taiwanensis TaxID=561966 RepID=UPI000402BF49|nr:hypothetical protein [Aliagarivorans taiwanensis]
MYKVSAIVFALLAIYGCQSGSSGEENSFQPEAPEVPEVPEVPEEPEGPDSPDVPEVPSEGDIEVCSVNPNNDVEDIAYAANVSVARAEEWSFIHSLGQAFTDAGDSPLPETNTMIHIAALSALGAAHSTDFMSAFASIYTCTEDLKAEHDCNWELPKAFEGGSSFRVRTNFSSDRNYFTTVYEDAGSGFNKVMTLSGLTNDRSNLTVTSYIDGSQTSVATYIRDEFGNESTVLIGDDATLRARESKDCSGEVTYVKSGEDDFVAELSASWTFYKGVTSGSLSYTTTAMDTIYQINW